MKTYLLFCLVLLASCATSLPNKSAGNVLVVDGGGFLLMGGSNVRYAMNYRLLSQSSGDMIARVSFENPADPQTPIVEVVQLPAGTTDFIVQSPDLPCISNNQQYSTVVDVERAGVVLERISQPVLFSMTQSILDNRNIGSCRQ